MKWLPIARPGAWIIVAPALFGALLGFLLSFTFARKYTSRTLLLIEPADQNDSSSGSFRQFIQQSTNLQDLLSEPRLKSMMDRMGVVRGSKSVEQELGEIRRHTRVRLVAVSVNDSTQTKSGSSSASSPNAVELDYTGSSPAEAQLICDAITAILLQQNVDPTQQETAIAGELSQKINAAKQSLNEANAKLSRFRRRHAGQLPADLERSMADSIDLNVQLKMLSQKVESTRKDKTDAESLLRQRLLLPQQKSEKHDSSQKIADKAALEKQLSDSQSQLLQLQAQYADDHPDVLKTKRDIAAIEKQLAAIPNNGEPIGSDSQANDAAPESSDVRQLRSQIQQDDEVLAQTAREQKRIQSEITVLGRELHVDPKIASDYERLRRDRDVAQDKYANVSTMSPAAFEGNSASQEKPPVRLRMLYPATLPRSPSSPNRILFAISGWLCLAVVLRVALWLERPDHSSGALRAALSNSAAPVPRTRPLPNVTTEHPRLP
ncbi:MAG: hypothetical protein JOZ80_10450 [Acidobacteriaceae bacterium]|nr:hypothetical protein [Acidobacteriaceae bacterium]